MYIKIFSDNLIPVLISAGVSLLFSIIYFLVEKFILVIQDIKNLKYIKNIL